MFSRVGLTELHGLSSALTLASSFGFPNQSLTTSIAFGQSICARRSPRAEREGVSRPAR
jgi:hypothetical protein